MNHSSDKSAQAAGTDKDTENDTAGPANRGTVQQARDEQEKRKHPASENDLKSSQDKNPVPPDAVRH